MLYNLVLPMPIHSIDWYCLSWTVSFEQLPLKEEITLYYLVFRHLLLFFLKKEFSVLAFSILASVFIVFLRLDVLVFFLFRAVMKMNKISLHIYLSMLSERFSILNFIIRCRVGNTLTEYTNFNTSLATAKIFLLHLSMVT